MASHFYGMTRAKAFTTPDVGSIDVATSSTSADPIELRVDDLTVPFTRAELYAACEKLAAYLANFYGLADTQ